MTQVRCFVAIDLEPPTGSLVAEVARSLCDAAPSWAGEKWVAPTNLHVTAKFLGNLPAASLAPLAVDVSAGIQSMSGFGLPVKGLYARPSARTCSLVWVEFDDCEERYSALCGVLDDIAAGYGVPRDQRKQRAHVTIVRARRPKPLPSDALRAASRLLDRLAPVVSVARATIFSSTLTPSGPIYESIAIAPLRDDAVE